MTPPSDVAAKGTPKRRRCKFCGQLKADTVLAHGDRLCADCRKAQLDNRFESDDWGDGYEGNR